MESDLLPATDGLFLGQTTTPRRWDGSKLTGIMRMTFFGGLVTQVGVWNFASFTDLNFNGYAIIAKVPSGKTFKLWALGQSGGGTDWDNRIRAYNTTTGSSVRTTAYGVQFESYTTPYTASGACNVQLQMESRNQVDQVMAYMVFGID